MSNVTFPERVQNLDQSIRSKIKSCIKRPIHVGAVQIDTGFRVETIEGNYKQGKPGDYLMCGIDGKLYICDRDIFERTYEWVDNLVDVEYDT